MLKIRFNLQFFGEGGDGASAGEGAEGGMEEAMDAELARIPQRARETYKRARAKTMPTQPTEVPEQPTPAEEEPKAHVSYHDLIKSDEYKEEHKAYMDKTISERLKKYKGIEESNKKMSDALTKVATKYGIDASSDTFLDDLVGRIDKDDSYYEDYAMEHDISVDDAKEILSLKNEVAKNKAEEKRRAEAEAEFQREQQMQAEIDALRRNAEQTKSIYPSFNLEAEMQDEKFRVLCAATHGDTLAAYRAVHHNELMNAQSQAITLQAQQQVANTVNANKARPIENGLSSQAATVTETNWKNASLADIRKQADIWRRGR